MAPNSHFVLFPITATIKSFVFSVLSSFLGDTYKKESGIEKENKTNRNVGLIVVLMIIKYGSDRTLDTKRILR